MPDEPTCGRGLAEHSVFPAKLAELMAAVAEVLETHRRALDASDESSRAEDQAYRKLTKEHRESAESLRSIGEQMAGYGDLPMGRHDEEAMASPAFLETFRQFVKVEEELLAILKARVEKHQEMLGAMDEGV